MVRAGRRRARRADPAHARARALLRRARIRRPALSAARARRAARRVPRSAAPAAPVLVLLALAGLLRPEAWAFSALYWLYLVGLTPRWACRSSANARFTRARSQARKLGSRGEIARLTLLAASAPLVWMLSDLAITGDPLWSLTNTRHTADNAHRVTGIANVPQYIPRRIGEILRPPVLVGAALGGVLSLLWLRRRALLGAAAGVLAVRRVRRVRLRRPADQHPLRVPRRGDPVHLLRRRRLRLDPPRARGPAAALVDGRRRARARRAARLLPSSTTPRTANWTNSRASSTSKATCSRSSATAPSACAAVPSACPTTPPCRCSRCT